MNNPYYWEDYYNEVGEPTEPKEVEDEYEPEG
jgi:hypothetical protein